MLACSLSAFGPVNVGSIQNLCTTLTPSLRSYEYAVWLLIAQVGTLRSDGFIVFALSIIRSTKGSALRRSPLSAATRRQYAIQEGNEMDEAHGDSDAEEIVGELKEMKVKGQ